jgi:RNase P/RNase MRP subunit p30
MNIKLELQAKNKKQSRDIVKEIINFGVTEEQKYDIMFNLALTLENNSALKSITKELKNFITTINNDEEVNKIKIENKNKIIIE